MPSLVGNIPRHLYVYVDSAFTHREPQGFLPAVWFGLVAFTGRAWGCTVMLQSGAVYRNLPPHAIAFREDPEHEWRVSDAQTWDCYGRGFEAIEYEFLAGMRVKARTASLDLRGEYLFTVAPVGDAYSAYPDQAKEFMFIQLQNGRLTIQPTDRVVFEDLSFTENPDLEFPKGLKRQTEVWNSE